MENTQAHKQNPVSTTAHNASLIFRLHKAVCSELGCNGTQKAVLTALLDRWNPKANGTLIWPSIELLALQTGYSDKTVSRALHHLHNEHLIKIRRRHGQKNNQYTLNIDEISSRIVIAKCADIVSKTTPGQQKCADIVSGQTTECADNLSKVCGHSVPLITKGNNLPLNGLGYSTKKHVEKPENSLTLLADSLPNNLRP